ncbi:MAG: hypothetical protein R3313_00835 [Candidatus Saccharimonadales bacterium]|nr:hypothetical protein [Candidatus Saccharimonadales bacterium]
MTGGEQALTGADIIIPEDLLLELGNADSAISEAELFVGTAEAKVVEADTKREEAEVRYLDARAERDSERAKLEERVNELKKAAASKGEFLWRSALDDTTYEAGNPYLAATAFVWLNKEYAPGGLAAYEEAGEAATGYVTSITDLLVPGQPILRVQTSGSRTVVARRGTTETEVPEDDGMDGFSILRDPYIGLVQSENPPRVLANTPSDSPELMSLAVVFEDATVVTVKPYESITGFERRDYAEELLDSHHPPRDQLAGLKEAAETDDFFYVGEEAIRSYLANEENAELAVITVFALQNQEIDLGAYTLRTEVIEELQEEIIEVFIDLVESRPGHTDDIIGLDELLFISKLAGVDRQKAESLLRAKMKKDHEDKRENELGIIMDEVFFEALVVPFLDRVYGPVDADGEAPAEN